MAMSKKRRADLLLHTMKEGNYNPLEELIRLATSKGVDTKTKIKIATDMMQYVYPKQKAVEVDQKQGQQVTFNFDLTGASTEDRFDLSGDAGDTANKAE